jgi:hypothetical protein
MTYGSRVAFCTGRPAHSLPHAIPQTETNGGRIRREAELYPRFCRILQPKIKEVDSVNVLILWQEWKEVWIVDVKAKNWSVGRERVHGILQGADEEHL